MTERDIIKPLQAVTGDKPCWFPSVRYAKPFMALVHEPCVKVAVAAMDAELCKQAREEHSHETLVVRGHVVVDLLSQEQTPQSLVDEWNAAFTRWASDRVRTTVVIHWDSALENKRADSILFGDLLALFLVNGRHNHCNVIVAVHELDKLPVKYRSLFQELVVFDPKHQSTAVDAEKLFTCVGGMLGLACIRDLRGALQAVDGDGLCVIDKTGAQAAEAVWRVLSDKHGWCRLQKTTAQQEVASSSKGDCKSIVKEALASDKIAELQLAAAAVTQSAAPSPLVGGEGAADRGNLETKQAAPAETKQATTAPAPQGPDKVQTAKKVWSVSPDMHASAVVARLWRDNLTANKPLIDETVVLLGTAWQHKLKVGLSLTAPKINVSRAEFWEILLAAGSNLAGLGMVVGDRIMDEVMRIVLEEFAAVGYVVTVVEDKKQYEVALCL